jgi:hypothetical protein
MTTLMSWIRNIVVEVPAIAFQGFEKAEKEVLERAAIRIRSIAAEFGQTNARPLIFDGPEICPQCNQRSMLFIWPHKVCDGCWKQALNHALLISRLSFWPEVEKIAQACRDYGDYPLEGALTIDLKESGPEDRRRLSKIENPAGAIGRQINALFARNNVADKIEARPRDNNSLYICSTLQ